MRRMKIYFAASIRGGRDDQAHYRTLIDCLGRFGDVLTEHVGQAELTETGEGEASDHEIFERDLSWLHDADLVVAEVSTPSLGVGYEIARAEQLGKPILCLHHELDDRRLSAMLAGNRRLIIREYDGPLEIEQHLEEFFSSIPGEGNRSS